MKNTFKFRFVLLPVALLLGVLTSSSEAKEVERPFKGVATAVTNSFVFENPAPELFQPENPNDLDILGYFDIAYVGRATHMGKMTRQEYAVLYADGSFEGLMIFVAANGDELYATLDGSLDSLGPPTEGSGCYYFFGGTGRFENASGITCFELFTPDFNDVFVSFDGVVKF